MLRGCLIFATGALAGVGATWFVMNKKLTEEMNSREEKIQEAIDQVKKAYSCSEKNQELKAEVKLESDKPSESEDKKEIEKIASHYNIFENGEEDLTTVYLTYIRKDDVVLYNDSLIVMEDPEECLGDDFRELFDDSLTARFVNEDEGFIFEVDVDEDSSVDEIVAQRVEDDLSAYTEGGV